MVTCALLVTAGLMPACVGSEDDVGPGPEPAADRGEALSERSEGISTPTRWLVCQAQSGTALSVLVSYRLRTIQTFPPDDRYASVDGQFWAFPEGGSVIHGRSRGTLTPRQWYGGAFDLNLTRLSGASYGRFLILRNNQAPYLWIESEGGEPRDLSCTGAMP
jgi:hypothetical protein